MGTVTHKGWSTSADEIPQPTSIIMGRNPSPRVARALQFAHDALKPDARHQNQPSRSTLGGAPKASAGSKAGRVARDRGKKYRARHPDPAPV
jgi:hypothetical protein